MGCRKDQKEITQKHEDPISKSGCVKDKRMHMCPGCADKKNVHKCYKGQIDSNSSRSRFTEKMEYVTSLEFAVSSIREKLNVTLTMTNFGTTKYMGKYTISDDRSEGDHRSRCGIEGSSARRSRINNGMGG